MFVNPTVLLSCRRFLQQSELFAFLIQSILCNFYEAPEPFLCLCEGCWWGSGVRFCAHETFRLVIGMLRDINWTSHRLGGDPGGLESDVIHFWFDLFCGAWGQNATERDDLVGSKSFRCFRIHGSGLGAVLQRSLGRCFRGSDYQDGSGTLYSFRCGGGVYHIRFFTGNGENLRAYSVFLDAQGSLLGSGGLVACAKYTSRRKEEARS